VIAGEVDGPSESLPLTGIRILDFTHAAAGPYATMLLGDLGADVMKIERPGRGDGSRTMGEPMHGQLNSDYYLSINRNKRSLAVDVSTDGGRGLVRRLVAHCDVVVQNFRPGVMDRLGLGYDDLRLLRGGLVYGSISAFGESGPWRERPANDIIMQSVSGLMGTTGEFGGGPVRIGVPIADYASGLFLLSGLLAALLARADHPEGQHVRVNMLDASIAMAANYIPAVTTLGERLPRLGRQHAQIVPYQAFICADGEYLMVGAFTTAFWRRLCDAVGRPEWRSDERYRYNAARLHNRDGLIRELEAIFATRTRNDWLRILEAADVPCSPVLELDEAVRLPQAQTNGTLVRITEGERVVDVVDSPIRTEEWARRTPSMPPRLGEHTASVLAQVLGMTSEEVEALTTEGVFGPDTDR
jgi:crotonobetainyl-CoA:carnitine CoA-transferase CaiB-like acyl-CoA transferase